MDAHQELQVLCAAHDLGLELRQYSLGSSSIVTVWDVDAQDIVARSVSRDGALAWLAERVFETRPFGQIDWA